MTWPSTATTQPPPSSCRRAAQARIEASSTPTATTLWASWATVEAKAPRRRPKPVTSPRPTRPVAWWRSMTAILARSRVGSAMTWPFARAGETVRAIVISCSGMISITRTSPSASSDRSASVERGAADGAEHVGRRAPARRTARRRPSRAATRPPASTSDGRERLEVVEHDEVGAEAGRDRPEAVEPVRLGGVQRRHHEHVLDRDALGDRDPAHLVDVALAQQHVRLAVVGAERAELRPVLAHQRQQVAQVARVGGLAQQHPHPAPALLERLLDGRRLVVGADARPRRRRRARGRARPARARRRARRRAPRACASTSGSPAMTPGKFIISATPSARRRRRIASMSPTVSSRRGDSNALAGTHEGAITNTVSGRPSEASSIQCTPSEPSTLATSCGSQTIAVVPWGRTARANCAGVSLEDSTCMCASMKPGHEEAPARVDPLAALVGRRSRRSSRRRSRRRRRATRACARRTPGRPR